MLPKIKTYKDLIVWKKSRELVKIIYSLSSTFPHQEQYGLGLQMRRAAISIPSNIAEGFGRRTQKETSQFLYIAYGSLLELETQLLLSIDLGFVALKDSLIAQQLMDEIGRMLNSLKNRTFTKPSI
jgi:four helix bundle protein